MTTSRQSGAISRKLLLCLAIPVLIALFIVGWRSVLKRKHEHARKVWKNQALVQLAQTSMTNQQILTELDQIKHPAPNRIPGWTQDHVMLMTNGEFMVYASRHGFDNGFVDHLFLARGSDARWYYSTYHFCNNMVIVSTHEPPGSIAEFVARYAVREFDGKSDICLQRTWPD